MKIVVLDGFTLNPGDNPWTEIERFGELEVFDRCASADGDTSEIVNRARDADVLLTNKTPLSASAIEKLPRLRFISVMATGFDLVDVDEARSRGIAVSNVPVYGTDSVAQHVFAVLLSMIHRPQSHDAAIRSGDWKASGDFSFWLHSLVELSGLTMGIIGFGRIGRRVGELANAFGMYVLAHDPHPGKPPSYRDRFDYCSLEQVFAESDVISLHCPLNPSTTSLVGAKLLDLVRPSAYLINTSRGRLIDESELAKALNDGRLAGACLDVVSREPISDDNPLLRAKNCLLTPHNAWGTLAARKRLMQLTADNIEAFISGHPINVVNG